jgi:hypothetical protein
VLTAIDFHDESSLRGVEVDDILAQRLLPVEWNVENLFSANPHPETPLRVGHVGAKSA